MLIVDVVGDRVRRRLEGQGAPVDLAVPVGADGDLPAVCAAWSERYRKAVAAASEMGLQTIGTELFAWLDQGGGLRDWLARPERALEVWVAPDQAGPIPEAVLALPWEILYGDDEGFLARGERLFTVARRCGGTGEPPAPVHSDLALIFMAAAPQGQVELDYEAEEAAILEATRARGDRPALAHVQVEESGALEFLAERLRPGVPFEALHLSCHGEILQGKEGVPSPVLLLETAAGEADEVTPGRLMDELVSMPPLVFVSACRTAERGEGRKDLPGVGEAVKEAADPARGSAPEPKAPELAEPLVRRLSTRAANVVGWDGSVSDQDATLFAERLYGDLARGMDVPRAAARARRAVFAARDEDPQRGGHWHLARVYLGPGGGGVLCDPRAEARPPTGPAEEAFLDPKTRQMKVPSRSEFVGRRRAIQRVLGAYREGARGVLIHGIGNLGKSSLASRVVARMPQRRAAVVVGACDASRVFAALKAVAEDIASELPLKDARQLEEDVAALERDVAEDPRALAGALRRLLNGAFKTQPVLLILDDLEQALERPSAERSQVEPQADYREALAAVLAEFARTQTRSRLLLTSRYDFALPDGAEGDLAGGLVRVPLPPMAPRERRKQFRARVRGREAVEADAREFVEAALEAAGGNPGLQEALTRPILAGEAEPARRAIEAVRAFRERAELPPPDQDPGDFFQRMAFDVYGEALSGAERTALAGATLFAEQIPVPHGALEAVAVELGLADAARALKRLLALGLLDDWGEMAGWPGMARTPHAAANPLARPLAGGLNEAQVPRLAAAALPELAAAWQDADGHFPSGLLGEEAVHLALRADPPPAPALLSASATAAVTYRYAVRNDARGALAIAEPVMAALEAASYPAEPLLLGYTVNAAERLGEVDLQHSILHLALGRGDLSRLHQGQFLALRANLLSRRGDPTGARADLDKAISIFEALGVQHSLAVARGKLADLHEWQGDLAEARRIREVEELPVYEALGDRRSIALTRGKIADLLAAGGDLDQARRIHEEEEIPVYEQFGYRREMAHACGKIADIVERQGRLADARRIREEEELPVYEALGYRREIALVRGKIADILERQGDLTEARRIREEEELPVYEALGCRREFAVARAKIANILEAQGDLAEARRIQENEVLPVVERLGDKEQIAVAWGRIADILTRQGDLSDARRILQEECLPIMESRGDSRGLAVIRGKIANVLAAQGDLDGALALHLERLPLARKMTDLDSVAHIHLSSAQIRLQRGDHERGELQTIYEELAEAFAITRQIERPDAIGTIGALLGQVLAMDGQPDEAVNVLEEAAAAFDKIEQPSMVAQCRQLIGQIKGGGS